MKGKLSIEAKYVWTKWCPESRKHLTVCWTFHGCQPVQQCKCIDSLWRCLGRAALTLVDIYFCPECSLHITTIFLSFNAIKMKVQFIFPQIKTDFSPLTTWIGVSQLKYRGKKHILFWGFLFVCFFAISHSEDSWITSITALFLLLWVLLLWVVAVLWLLDFTQ